MTVSLDDAVLRPARINLEESDIRIRIALSNTKPKTSNLKIIPGSARFFNNFS